MNNPEQTKVPRNMPTIFLRSDELPQNEPKKILRPKTLNDLKIKAKKLFKLQNPITAIYDDHSKIQIEDIYEVIAGRTYLISSKSIPKKPQKRSLMAKNMKNEENRKKSTKQVSLKSDDDYSYSDDVLSFPATPKADEEKRTNETTTTTKKRRSNLPIFHTTKKINPDTDQDNEIKYYGNQEEDDLKYYVTDTTSSEFISIEKQANIINENSNEGEVEEKGEEKEKEEENSVVRLFDEAFPNHGMTEDINSILHLLPKEYLNFAQTALELENQQKSRWVSSLLSIASECNLSYEEEKVNYFQDIKSKCLNIISNHFFASQSGISTSIKSVIDGPSASGKTLFLSILLNQYITTLASYNMWKNNFIIILNCEDFSFYAADPKILYFHFVKVTVEHLKAQVPESIPHLAMIKKHFETIVNENYLPVLPKKFTTNPATSKLANSIKIVSALINQNWQSLNGRQSFCTLIFLLPVLIAKNLGYKDITLFVDHFDLINLEIDEMDHFPESFGELFLVDYFKNVLIQTNFVISSKDSNELWQCFQPFDESSIDLTNIVSFETTMDTNSEPKYGDREFTFSIEGINCKISAQHFGGIPAFLTKWIELNQLMDDVDDTALDSEEYEECYMDVVNLLQSILPLIFSDAKSNQKIKNVKRRTK